jgi:5-methylcytosine-specific restriction endonuclease McrA
MTAQASLFDLDCLVVPVKTCPGCREVLPRDAFARDRSRRDGLNKYCRPCVQELDRARRAANPEKAREHRRAWRAANPEKAREKDRARRAANPEKAREKVRAWKAANPEKKRQQKHRRRARKAANGVHTVTPRDLARLAAAQCAHAHLGGCHGPTHVDHVVPIARGGAHGIGNLQALCARHNISKGDRLEIEVKARHRRQEVAA